MTSLRQRFLDVTRRPPARAFLSIVLCLALWLVLSAPRVLRNASAAEEGTRRTVAIRILEPIAELAEASGLASLTGAIETAFGKDPTEQPGGELDLDQELAGQELTPIPDEEFTVKDRRKHRPPRNRREVTRDAPLRTPTRRYRLRVAVIGDSVADGVGDAMKRGADPEYVHVLNLGRIATGLARADYFDWVAALAKIETRYTPDVVVVVLGGNDKQSVVFPGGRAVISGDEDWGAAYRQRIGDLLAAAEPRTHVVWVGLPPVRDRGKSRLFRVYNSMYEGLIAQRRNAAFVDIWELFDDAEGNYRPYGRGPDGSITLLRAKDGAHMTPAGYGLIYRAIRSLLVERWDLAPRYLE